MGCLVVGTILLSVVRGLVPDDDTFKHKLPMKEHYECWPNLEIR